MAASPLERRFEKQRGALAQPPAAQLPARGKPRKCKKGPAAAVRACSRHLLTVNSGPLVSALTKSLFYFEQNAAAALNIRGGGATARGPQFLQKNGGKCVELMLKTSYNLSKTPYNTGLLLKHGLCRFLWIDITERIRGVNIYKKHENAVC